MRLAKLYNATGLERFKLWHAAGYNVASIALAMNLGPRAIRQLGYLAGLEQGYGRKSFPAAWFKGVRSRLFVPEGLAEAYKRFKVMFKEGKELDLVAIQKVPVGPLRNFSMGTLELRNRDLSYRRWVRGQIALKEQELKVASP